MRVTIVCASLAIISGCCGPTTIAPFDAPPRPALVGLTEAEIQSTPDSVLDKFDRNIIETQGYVLKTESRVRIGGNP